jgi:two-component system response regulator FixJ
MNDRLLVRIVDDEESVRSALSRLIRVAGYDVESYDSGVSFLAAEQRSRSSCVILDLAMPGLSGHDVQLSLAAHAVRTPVIVISAQDNPTLLAQCVADGACAMLRKPLRAGELLEAIRRATGSHAA